MILFRSLLYIGFVIAVLVGWYFNGRKQSYTDLPSTDLETPLDTSEAIDIALKQPHWKTRLLAVEQLRNGDSPQAFPHLIAMLDDPVFDVRQAAAQGIIHYADEAIPHLADVLEMGRLNAREMAIKTLCAIGTDATVDVLAKALQNDESAWVRIPAAEGLGAIGGEKALFALLNALDDEHPDVVKTVESALHHNMPIRGQNPNNL